MNDTYIGRHRLKKADEIRFAFDFCVQRDAQARLGNHPYQPRHSTDFPREVAR